MISGNRRSDTLGVLLEKLRRFTLAQVSPVPFEAQVDASFVNWNYRPDNTGWAHITQLEID